MDRTVPSIVVAAFEDHLSAAHAINELQRAHFRADQFGLAEVTENPTDLFTILSTRGVPEEDARFYAQQYTQGHPIVTLSIDPNEEGMLQHGTDILSRNGSYKVPRQPLSATERAGNPVPDPKAASSPTSASTISQAPAENEPQPDSIDDQPHMLQLREEVLETNKKLLQTGEVVISKRLITEEKIIRVPVTREELTIEHRPRLSNPKTSTDGKRENSEEEAIVETEAGRLVELAEGEIIRIPLYEEIVNVTKTPVVKEEVILGKRTVQETREVRETIRHEVPVLDQQGGVDIQLPGENTQTPA